ncbi:MAG TPA: hypothetical protein VKM55_00810 [Candidatus Lokiarchaeia archaeon]|nr:hypothetical protein [Candidatus Lokiarchaeia archaeon]
MIERNKAHAMEKLVYTLISSAYFVDEHWGYGSPHDGIITMGKVAHKPRSFNGVDDFAIPITWLVSSKSAMIEHELLTSFHEQFGDAVGYMLNYQDHAMNRHRDLMTPENKDILQAHIAAEIDEIKEILPWADVQVVGTGYRSNSLVQVLEELGIPGMWGSCPFQIGTDEITDSGAPWGQWYVNPGNYKRPKKSDGKVINVEWTCRDLNKSFHYAQPEAYSTDPNDAESESKCTDTNVEYWKAFLNQYLRNLDLNDYIFFHQHQEAHEMEATPTCIPFMESGQQRIDYTASMLDLFLDHLVTQDDVLIVTVNEALHLYHERYKGNQPEMFMRFDDIPIYELSPDYKTVVDGKPFTPKHIWLSFNDDFYHYINNFVSKDNWRMQEPPWKESFFYYDAECMLVFDKPINQPVWICNYTDEENREFNDEIMMSEAVPPAGVTLLPASNDEEKNLTVTISVKAEKQMPYGILVWGSDFELCTIDAQADQLIQTRVISDELLFARFNLNRGSNDVSLAIKHGLKER